MIIGVVREQYPGETRVALVPAHIPEALKLADSVVIETGAGTAAGYGDEKYREKGAEIFGSRAEVLAKTDVLLTIRSGAASEFSGAAKSGSSPLIEDLAAMKEGAAIIGNLEPYKPAEVFQQMADRKLNAFAMELIPRITRAQSMDVLSSMANLAGYKAVLLGASALSKMFPMMMTAAGTIVPSRVFIIGAGVAGLQAIATAKRLGAVVSAYDVRPAVKEQVESLGAKFVEMELETDQAEGAGGYAKEMGEDFYRKQREFMTEVLKETDVVITTAAIPGKPSPILITAEMVKSMPLGSVIVDLAAERGGNCELTKPGDTVDENGVKILGPVNLPATLPFHASQLFSKNIITYLAHIVAENALQSMAEDDIIKASKIINQGEIVHSWISETKEG